ncbi:hypothetical protein ACSYAD_26925 [Acaryochloris marina NIES-2412]|uniref:hypothetical protein n=1 Tax=Acaryochloris marina TaxID=155978 RepID=UPI004057FFB8
MKPQKLCLVIAVLIAQSAISAMPAYSQCSPEEDIPESELGLSIEERARLKAMRQEEAFKLGRAFDDHGAVKRGGFITKDNIDGYRGKYLCYSKGTIIQGNDCPPTVPEPDPAYDCFRQGSDEKLKSSEKAIESFSKAIQIDPKSGQSYLERADLYLAKINEIKDISERRKLQQKVIMDLSKAIAYLRNHNYYHDPDEKSLNKKIADAYFQKGSTLWNLGVNSSALEDLKKALALYDKSYSSSYDERILIFIEKIKKGEKPPGKYGCNAFNMCSNLIEWK